MFRQQERPYREQNNNFRTDPKIRKTTSYLDYVAVEILKAVLSGIEHPLEVDQDQLATFCYSLAKKMETIREDLKEQKYKQYSE